MKYFLRRRRRNIIYDLCGKYLALIPECFTVYRPKEIERAGSVQNTFNFTDTYKNVNIFSFKKSSVVLIFVFFLTEFGDFLKTKLWKTFFLK